MNNKYVKIGIILLIVLVSTAAITYGFLKANIGIGSTSNITISSKTVDELTFTKTGDLSLTVDYETLPKGGSDLTATASANAKLVANNATNSATATYNVYLDISNNELQYSEAGTPELIATIISPSGMITAIDDLDYITGQGFDITNKEGLYTVAQDYQISTTSSTTGTTQVWAVILTYKNLSINQGVNEDKSFHAELILEKDQSYRYWNDNFSEEEYAIGEMPSTTYPAYSSENLPYYVFIKTNESSGEHSVCLYYNGQEICFDSSDYWDTDKETTNAKIDAKLAAKGITLTTHFQNFAGGTFGTDKVFTLSMSASNWIEVYNKTDNYSCTLSNGDAYCMEDSA